MGRIQAEIPKAFGTPPIFGSEIKPNPNTARIYDKLIKKYAKCERETLRKMK